MSFAGVAKDSNASIGTRASAAKDALGDKAEQHGHEVSSFALARTPIEDHC